MRLHCLGLNHRTAKVAIREQLALSTQEIENLWQSLSQSGKIQELVVLSTCNRVELYAIAEQPAFEALEAEILNDLGLDPADREQYFYRLVDEQVVSHLLRVSAGLDSMVLGEPQILGQVTSAYELGLEINACGKILSRLFQTAIFTGKRVRTETTISQNSTSVSSIAARLISEKIDDLTNAKIVVLGAGEMAELAVGALRARGADNFHVISRTISSACALAAKWDGQAGTMENLNGALQQADILITSTSAPHTLIKKFMMQSIMKQRPDQPMVIIDIAVPRDVAPAVNEIPGVYVYDIDGLNQTADISLKGRQGAIPQVEAILSEEYQTFKEYWASLAVVPVIKEMRQQADTIRQQELDKALRRLNGLDQADQEQIAALTHSIVQKILHTPTVRLKQEAAGPEADKYALAARALFGLDAASPTAPSAIAEAQPDTTHTNGKHHG